MMQTVKPLETQTSQVVDVSMLKDMPSMQNKQLSMRQQAHSRVSSMPTLLGLYKK